MKRRRSRPGGPVGAQPRHAPAARCTCRIATSARARCNWFGGLLVHTGETLARCFERKRFVEFQSFLRMLFGSVWCREDPQPPPDPGQRLHPRPEAPADLDHDARPALPRPPSIGCPSTRPGSTRSRSCSASCNGRRSRPTTLSSTNHVRQRIRAFFAERNRRAQPIQWTYTAQKLLAKVRRQRRLAATG